MRSFLFVIAFMVGFTTHSAQATTVNELLQFCDIDRPISDYDVNDICHTYFWSATDTYLVTAAMFDEDKNQHFCPPDNATNGQLYGVAWKYFRDHPEQWHYEVAVLFFLSLVKAFPCP